MDILLKIVPEHIYIISLNIIPMNNSHILVFKDTENINILYAEMPSHEHF